MHANWRATANKSFLPTVKFHIIFKNYFVQEQNHSRSLKRRRRKQTKRVEADHSSEAILPEAGDDRKGYRQEVSYGKERDHALGVSFEFLLPGQRGEVSHLPRKQDEAR